jgi:hypothetical protein
MIRRNELLEPGAGIQAVRREAETVKDCVTGGNSLGATTGVDAGLRV